MNFLFQPLLFFFGIKLLKKNDTQLEKETKMYFLIYIWISIIS